MKYALMVSMFEIIEFILAKIRRLSMRSENIVEYVSTQQRELGINYFETDIEFIESVLRMECLL